MAAMTRSSAAARAGAGTDIDEHDAVAPSVDFESMQQALSSELRNALSLISTRLESLEDRVSAGAPPSASAVPLRSDVLPASSPSRTDLPPPAFGPRAPRPAAAVSQPSAAPDNDADSVRSGESTVLGDQAPLAACIGAPDPTKQHDPDARHLSKSWYDLLSDGKLKSSRAEVNLVTGAARAMLAALQFLDDIDAVVPQDRQAALELLRQALALSCSDCSQHLSTAQVRAVGYDEGWAIKLRDAARARLSAAQFEGLTVGGIPVACPYSAELIEGTLQRKLELSVRDLAAASASAAKTRSGTDVEALDNERTVQDLKAQLKEVKAEASAAKSRLGKAKTLLDEHNVAFDVSKVLPHRGNKSKGKASKDSKAPKTKTKAPPAAEDAAGGKE